MNIENIGDDTKKLLEKEKEWVEISDEKIKFKPSYLNTPNFYPVTSRIFLHGLLVHPYLRILLFT